jgi:sterol 3beta-glucosyltransferase
VRRPDDDDDDDSDSSDQAFDLAALKRSRLQHPGTISMFGSVSDQGQGAVQAEKMRELFELPSAEMIKTGWHSSFRLMVEFPAWLVKNVMIQGYMCLTEKHICFFAQLPRTNVCPLKRC